MRKIWGIRKINAVCTKLYLCGIKIIYLQISHGETLFVLSFAKPCHSDIQTCLHSNVMI